MARLTYLCLALICGLLAVSAQRPVGDVVIQPSSSGLVVNFPDNANSTPLGNITGIGDVTTPPASGPYSAAASGDGPPSTVANPNISLINPPNNTASPTTITTPQNTTSPFNLALLQALEQGAIGRVYPTNSYTLYLVDIHFSSGNLSSQYIAYHYCHFVSADFLQCALYNGRSANSRFIGIEYFITQAIFNTLPELERNLWHSHPFEVQTGLLFAPELSPEEDLEVAQWLMGTFGKVTDTWHYYEDFPLGPPTLGLALGLVSQVNWTLAAEMDQIFNLTTYQQRQQQRAGLVAPPRTPGADNYLFSGFAANYDIYSFPIQNNGAILGAASATGPVIYNATAPVGGNVTLPAATVNLDNLPTSSPQSIPGATYDLPNPSAPLPVVINPSNI